MTLIDCNWVQFNGVSAFLSLKQLFHFLHTSALYRLKRCVNGRDYLHFLVQFRCFRFLLRNHAQTIELVNELCNLEMQSLVTLKYNNILPDKQRNGFWQRATVIFL